MIIFAYLQLTQRLKYFFLPFGALNWNLFKENYQKYKIAFLFLILPFAANLFVIKSKFAIDANEFCNKKLVEKSKVKKNSFVQFSFLVTFFHSRSSLTTKEFTWFDVNIFKKDSILFLYGSAKRNIFFCSFSRNEPNEP